ncbi:MAG: metalloregulator ArsR/SmtB family transcription factor [Burkholderiales bacterium]|nr:metalloregulator ArsR/SmtB family transcription factor [Burkholderiales bacterium]
MSSEPVRQRLYEAIGRVAAALASAARLKLLEYVAQRERSVETLAAMAGLSVANASKHLQALRQAGLVSARKEGLRVYYALAGDDVARLLAALREVAERRAADVERLVRDFLAQRDALEPVPASELLERAKKGLVTVLDVRPEEEYAAGHLPGAINVPLERLERAIARLPRRKEIVAYCRGPYCLLAFEAVAKLRRLGFRARRLQNGFPEWRAAGLPVER